ncbi:hypothetical protein AB0H00_19285 [Nocardia sp. NPDC023852]|uniref:hypothetical protein n=1 Tax=Nocardia sp. NPDC023852 TaxID=3154697 RepID=UPI0033FDAD5A
MGPFDSLTKVCQSCARSLARESTSGRHALKYRLAVVAPSVVDAVRFAGGWLFDRVLAGWDATVLVHNPADALPLRILGANELELALGSPTNDGRPDAIALAGALVATDDRIQCGVLEALDRGLAEVMLWDAASLSAYAVSCLRGPGARVRAAATVVRADARYRD